MFIEFRLPVVLIPKYEGKGASQWQRVLLYQEQRVRPVKKPLAVTIEIIGITLERAVSVEGRS